MIDYQPNTLVETQEATEDSFCMVGSRETVYDRTRKARSIDFGEVAMLDLDRVSDQAPPGMGKIVHLLQQLDDQGEPIVISINGKAEIKVSDEGSFQKLVDLMDRLELLEVLRQATKELDEGKGLSLEAVKEQARMKYGISL